MERGKMPCRDVGNIHPPPLPAPPLLFVPSLPELPTDQYAIDLSDITVRRFPPPLYDIYGVSGDRFISVGGCDPLPHFPPCFGNPPPIHKILFRNGVFLAIAGVSGVLLRSYTGAPRWYPLHGADANSEPYVDISVFQDRFFAVDETGTVEAWAIAASSARRTWSAPLSTDDHEDDNDRNKWRFLVHRARDLLQVVRIGESDEFEEDEAGEFQLFRIFKMDLRGGEWTEISELEPGTALFVSRLWSGCADVRRSPACREDRVYGLLEEEANEVRWISMVDYCFVSQYAEKRNVVLCRGCPEPFWFPANPAAVEDKEAVLRMLLEFRGRIFRWRVHIV